MLFKDTSNVLPFELTSILCRASIFIATIEIDNDSACRAAATVQAISEDCVCQSFP